MSVNFAWILGTADAREASSLEARFRSVEATASSRITAKTATAVAGWYRDPTSIGASSRTQDVETSEAFHRAFHLPLEPFVHDVLFSGAAAPWPDSPRDVIVTTTDRIPPLATLALALGPAWVRSFPGHELQFFVVHDQLDALEDTIRRFRAIASSERNEMIGRACAWIGHHNFVSFEDAPACEGRDAAERLLDLLPTAVARARERKTCLFSACGVFP